MVKHKTSMPAVLPSLPNFIATVLIKFTASFKSVTARGGEGGRSVTHRTCLIRMFLGYLYTRFLLIFPVLSFDHTGSSGRWIIRVGLGSSPDLDQLKSASVNNNNIKTVKFGVRRFIQRMILLNYYIHKTWFGYEANTFGSFDLILI